MALTGKFLADFNSFFEACQKAEVSLRSFETGSVKVEKSLNKMADSLSGRALIQEATLMAQAVERIGGPSKLTTAELQRVGAQAAEAAEKMRALGLDVPPKMQTLANTAKDVQNAMSGATPAVSGLGSSLKNIDGILSSVGIHIGPEIKALGELGTVSGQTASQLGLLATAGLTVGAAVGGWKIGRIIADFTGSDKIIGDAAARLMGWTDGAERAGAKADVLALASQRAGHEVTTMAEAVKINAAYVEQLGLTFGRSKDPVHDSTQAVVGWRHEIGAVRREGHLAALTADLDSQNFSLEALSKKYGVHVEALQFFTRELKKAADQEAKLTAETERMAKIHDHIFGADLVAKAADYAKALGGVDNISRLTKDATAELHQVMGAAVDVLLRTGQGASAAAESYRLLRDMTIDFAAINAKIAAMPDPFAAQNNARRAAFRQTMTDQMDLNQGITDSQLYWAHAGEIADEAMKKADASVAKTTATVNAATEAVGKLAQGFFSIGPSNVQSLNDDAEKNLRRGGIASTVGLLQRQAATRISNNLPAFADGVNNFSGGLAVVGERGPELVNLPKGSSVFPNGTGMGVTVMPGAIVINGQGREAGRAAADALLARLQSKGVRV